MCRRELYHIVVIIQEYKVAAADRLVQRQAAEAS